MSEETVEYRTKQTVKRELHLNVNVSPEEAARLGMLFLKEAVLGILEQPEHREKGLKAADVSKALGIHSLRYSYGFTSVNRGYTLVNAILRHLEAEGQVCKLYLGLWRLEDNPPK